MCLKDFRSTERLVVDVGPMQSGLCDTPNSPSHCAGLCSVLGDVRIGLFLLATRLYLLWDGESVDLTALEDVQHTADGDRREFRLVCGTREFVVAYTLNDAPVSTPYYSEDDEDADFGLWLHNILSSPERTQSIVNGWRDGIP